MKIKLHPLFFAVIIFSALFGGLLPLCICLATALLHECGHLFCAAKMGFKCEGIKLMPYGAAALVDVEGIGEREEVRLALSGPAVNAAICICTVALWWFYPQSYAYTDVVTYANAGMCAVNMLPCYPLDGGRVAACLIARATNKRVAAVCVRALSIVVAAALCVLFFFSGYNVSLAVFAAFLCLSAIEKPPRARLINCGYRGRLKRGMEVKYVLCDSDLTLAKAFSLLDYGKFVVFQLYDGGIAEEVTEAELFQMAKSADYFDKVFHFSKNERPKIPPSTSPESTAAAHCTPISIASSTAPESEQKS